VCLFELFDIISGTLNSLFLGVIVTLILEQQPLQLEQTQVHPYMLHE
jgi:hypothetical protein